MAFGLFNSPTVAAVMNSVPARQRGAPAGVRSMSFNTGTVLSNGIFFSLMTAGLANGLPGALQRGLVAHAAPQRTASALAQLPPVSSLFAALLGYNPLATVVPSGVLQALPAGQAADLVGKTFFPHPSGPLEHWMCHDLQRTRKQPRRLSKKPEGGRIPEAAQWLVVDRRSRRPGAGEMLGLVKTRDGQPPGRSVERSLSSISQAWSIGWNAECRSRNGSVHDRIGRCTSPRWYARIASM